MKHILFCLCVAMATALPSAHAAGDEELVREGLTNNPEIRMAEAKWSMFREKVTQAGTFADPMLMLGIKNGLLRYPLEFDRDPTTAKVIGISQMLPIWGKRQLQRTVADQTARINGFDYEERRLELTRMIKETHAQLAYTDQSLRLLDRSIAILDDLIRFADTMYAVGEAQQQDVLKAQVELSRMRDMQLAAQQQRRSLEATMNTLLARPVLTPFPEQTDVELVRVSADAVTLAALAEERRPILRRLETQREKGKTGQQLAQKEYYPDFTLAIEYMQIEPLQGDDMSMDGDDMFNLTLSFNLPFQQEKRHAMVRESLAETRMANEELQLTRNLIARDLADGLARLDRNRQMAELYQRTIIPQSQSALDAAIASYRVGKVDFMNVLDGQMRLINYELQYYEAVADHTMQAAALENLSGGELIPPGLHKTKEVVP